MKKFITICSFVLMASIFFTACKSKGSITKRHYTKGYYVTHNKAKHKLHKKEDALYVSKINANKTAPSSKNTIEQTKVDRDISQTIEAKNNVAEFPREKFQRDVVSKPLNNKGLNYKPLNINKPFIELKQKLSKNEKLKKSSDEGLSLFGFIILLLLILWLFGFLVGDFGGLVHILLVIALVLLILWLLRIV